MSLSILLLPAAILPLILGSTAFLRSPRRAASVLLTVYVADTICLGLPAIPFGLHVYAQDIVFVFLITAAALRYGLALVNIERNRIAVLALLALVLFSFARGTATFGFMEAGVAAREFFWLFAGTAYFSSFEYGDKRLAAMIKLWQKAACALVALAVLRWAAAGLHMSIAATWEDPGNPMRVLDAAQAMFLCVAFFFSLMLKTSRKGRKWQQNLYYLIGPALILLQHRTVWVVAALGMVWMSRRNMRLLRKSLIVFGATFALVAVLVVSTFGLDFVIESLQFSVTSDNSFLWRVAGWYQLVFLRTAGAFNLLFGDPFGTGFTRVISTAIVEATPHSFYVETYLRMGVVGLCILLWFFESQFLACRRTNVESPAAGSYHNSTLWGLFLLFEVAYSITYNPGYEQCIIIGIIVGLNAMKSSVPAKMKCRILPESMLPDPS
ncbi:MAG TPA: hypothetical protein VGR47_00745 [Terracidiphilus sp.]|nr:hypothetical protein [Terracidiphilus sp.]